jgi:hypothetical protein
MGLALVHVLVPASWENVKLSGLRLVALHSWRFQPHPRITLGKLRPVIGVHHVGFRFTMVPGEPTLILTKFRDPTKEYQNAVSLQLQQKLGDSC